MNKRNLPKRRRIPRASGIQSEGSLFPPYFPIELATKAERFLGMDLRDQARLVGSMFPTHHRKYCPRNIAAPPGYGSPALLSAAFASETLLLARLNKAVVDASISGVSTREAMETVNYTQHNAMVLVGAAWSSLGCPTFFLGGDLAAALHATDISTGYPVPENWPLPSFALMLEKGCLVDGGHEVAAIVYTKLTPSLDTRTFDKYAMKGAAAVPVQPYPCVFFLTTDGGVRSGLFDPAGLGTNGGDYDFAMKVLVALQHSPALVDRAPSDVVREPGTPRRSRTDPHAKWSPNFIGRGYTMGRSRGDGDEPGQGGTRRPHIRRGHARRQRYGEGFAMVKDIWIEPVLVNWPESAEPISLAL